MMRMSNALLPLLRRATGSRFIFNVKPLEGMSPGEPLFQYASSPTGFERLSEALAEQTRGSTIDVATVTPKLCFERPRRVTAISAAQLSPTGKVDSVETAQRIVALIKARRPEWRVRQGRHDRRA
jgi:short-subunit dehydrogenase